MKKRIETLAQLEEIYGKPGDASLIKEVVEIIPHYRSFIEASPFCTLATVADEGMDCTPRGDKPGFVRVHDERTLMMPDRRGNNRTDSLANIVRDPRIALCFLVPGSNICLRVNGTAYVSIDEELLESFSHKGSAPRSVIVINTQALYFQCGRAILRSKLWDNNAQVDPATLPKFGEVLAWLSANEIGGKAYDDAWEERAKTSLW
ncbi:MAG: pyridoxamine 5'-phosphate oxidase family protein [Rhizobiaceae bacterium]|nr:pyridoxamine 5'-phosphate oxidase family protein [Rhizobiaceae bacterium]